MEKIGIYKIKNIITNDYYIGSSKNINKRWNEHKRTLKKGIHHSKILQNAYNKYGQENFIYEIIYECNVDDIIFYEQKFLNEEKPKYNILKIAGNFTGYKHSDLTKLKISKANKGKKREPLSDETKFKIGNANKGKVFTNTHKKKLSDARKNIIISEETKLKLKQKASPERMREMQIKTVEARKINGTYKVSEKVKKAVSEANSVEVIAIDIKTNEIIYDFKSCKEAYLFLNKSESTMWRILKNKKEYKGYLWMKKKDFVR